MSTQTLASAPILSLEKQEELACALADAFVRKDVKYSVWKIHRQRNLEVLRQFFAERV